VLDGICICHFDDNFKVAILCFLPISKHFVPAARHNVEPENGFNSIILIIENNEIFFIIIAEDNGSFLLNTDDPEKIKVLLGVKFATIK
jgi:hypothetical protein